jgi:hypothetical protein
MSKGIRCLQYLDQDGVSVEDFLLYSGYQLIGFIVYTALFGIYKICFLDNLKLTRSNAGKVSLSRPISFVYIIWSRIGRQLCRIISLLPSLLFSCFITFR